MRIILALSLTITGASCLHSFQSSAAAPSKRGSIRGQVLQSKSGEPVKKVLVILRRGQEPGTGALTDASGAFRLDDLEPGPCTLSAERNGFILEPELARGIVNVKPAPDESEVTLKLLRTGTISGRVLDGDGDPLIGASVQVVSVNRKGDVVSSFNAATNDRGDYRAFNIPPGKYHIAVSYEPGFQQHGLNIGGVEDTWGDTREARDDSGATS